MTDIDTVVRGRRVLAYQLVAYTYSQAWLLKILNSAIEIWQASVTAMYYV